MKKQFGEVFKQQLAKRTETHQTRILHALDLANTLPPEASNQIKQDLVDRVCQLATAIEPYIAGLKLNYPLILGTGLEIVHKLKSVVPEIPIIADLKVADIDNTNAWIARHTFSAGFDAIIVQGFIGNDAIQGVLTEAKNYGGRGVILVVDMSHPGSAQFIHPQARNLARIAVDLGVTGVIAPGTRPEHVLAIRSWIGPEILIFAPGVGAQGGVPGSAIAAGANYEIVGRSIYNAENPVSAAQEFAFATYNAIRQPINQIALEEKIAEKVALLLQKVGAWQFGEFTLASGKSSPYYIDLRVLPSYPDEFNQLITLFIRWLDNHPEVKFDRIAGVPTAGLSFATLLSHRLSVPLLYVRKAPKQYGHKQRVEGLLNKEDRILVIDDLITDGKSKIEIINSLREEGAKVTDVLVVVNREQGGRETLQQEGITLRYLVSISQLIEFLQRAGHLTDDQATQISKYLQKDSS